MMDYILCFVAGTFFGTFISALAGYTRRNDDCDVRVVVVDCDEDEDDEEDDEEYEDGE